MGLTIRDYDALLGAGNRAQLEKLKANEHSGGWKQIALITLLDLVIGEVLELKEECVASYPSPEMIRSEAADVANYAHMIIERCDELLSKANATLVGFVQDTLSLDEYDENKKLHVDMPGGRSVKASKKKPETNGGENNE